MKLNKRLATLSEMVNEPYDVVWDCCCDHGLLGFKILSDGLVKQVNFVDVVPEITQQLTQKLSTYAHHLPNDITWNVLCKPVGELNLRYDLQSNITGYRQLVIISGVGGELIIEMLKELMSRYAGENIEFLLCPVQHTYKLRRALTALNFKLIREQLVVENNRGYELILVNQVGEQPIDNTGTELWLPTAAHRYYLSKLIAHYQRVVASNNVETETYQQALQDYQQIFKRYYQSL
jgi:tRNA (adenine22-N1)-methyltransferase